MEQVIQSESVKAPPIRPNKDLQLLQEAGKHLDKFLCQGDQRTDLEDSEVILVSILDEWAANPYPISKEISLERGMNIKEGAHPELSLLKDFSTNYKKFRISRKRKGREEDKQVMMSYMNAIMDALRDHEKNSVPGYLK